MTVVWSITSGKRQITMDGKEVHFSVSRGSVLDFSWSIRDNHVIKVVAHASPPLSAVPGFRQYDMFIDGQSFFTMPKVYELGIKGPSPAYGNAPRWSGASRERPYDLHRGGYIDAPTSTYEEEAALKRAIAESLEESRQHMATRGKATPEPPEATADLLDFDAPAPSAYPALMDAPMQDTQSLVSPPMQDTQSLVAYQGSSTQYPGAPPAIMSADAMSYSSASTYIAQPAQNLYAPQPPAQNQYAPQPPAQYQYAPQPPVQNQYAPPPAQYAPVDQFAARADDPFAPKPPPPPSLSDITSTVSIV